MLYTKWIALLEDTHFSAPQIELLGTLAVQLLFFWLPGILLLSLHQYLASEAPSASSNKPTWLPFRVRVIPHLPSTTTSGNYQLQIQPSIWDLVSRVFGNQFYLFLTHTLLLTLLPSPFTISPTLPTPGKLAIDFAIALPIADYFFYIVHRTLHTHPFLYKNIHRIHHRWRHPVSLAAQYAHPIEFLLGNWWVVWAPLSTMGWIGKSGLLRATGWRWAIEGVHVTEWWIFWGGVLLETVIVHGGLEIVWGWNKEKTKDAWVKGQRGLIRRHDLHHEVGAGGGRVVTGGYPGRRGVRTRRRWGNFGTFWWMDWLHGTEIVPFDDKEQAQLRRTNGDDGDVSDSGQNDSGSGFESGIDSGVEFLDRDKRLKNTNQIKKRFEVCQ